MSDEERGRTGETESVYDTRTWSPGQIVAGLVGFLLIVIGGIALARLGFSGSITGETTEVIGVTSTRLWAIIQVVLGLIMLGIASSPYRVRSGLATFGILAAAFGVIVAVEPDAFGEALGAGRTTGWVWLIGGAVLIVAAWLSPTIVSSRRRS